MPLCKMDLCGVSEFSPAHVRVKSGFHHKEHCTLSGSTALSALSPSARILQPEFQEMLHDHKLESYALALHQAGSSLKP